MKKYALSNEQIDACVADAEAFLAACRIERRDRLRVRLALEETLLRYQGAFGPEGAFSLDLIKRFGRPRITFTVAGERADPLSDSDEAQSGALRGILENMGAAPHWQYKNGENIVSFTPGKRKRSQLAALFMAIVAAFALGFACRLLPVNAQRFLSDELISPVFSAFMGLLSAVAGPMIFLSVTWGIYSIGDTATLGKIGRRMVGRYLLMTLLLTVVGGALMAPLFPMGSDEHTQLSFSALFKLILDIVPNNFLTPFTEGNPLQIIFVAAIFGLAMLILSAKTTVAAAFVEQSNAIVQLIMETISALVPLFIFGSMFTMVLSDSLYTVASYLRLPLIMLIGEAAVMIAYVVLVCARKKVRVATLLKKTMPTFLIGLTTSSSSAAFAENVSTCENKLGIHRRVVNFGVPLGQVIFMPGAAIQFLAVALYMAWSYNVVISLNWLIVALLIVVVLAVAAPPIPGGALTCYTILFAQMGIPLEALAITIALNTVLEFAATAVNLFCLQSELVIVADSLDLLDRDALRAPLAKPRGEGDRRS